MALLTNTAFIALLLGAPLAFAQEGTISGTVVDATGAALAHADVRLSLEGNSPVRVTQSGDDGAFSFSNVAPGPYQLSLTAKGFAPKNISGELHAGETANLPTAALAIDKLTTEVNVTQTRTEIAEAQIKTEEKQRLIGIVPSYYIVYDHDAAPLDVRQKGELAWKTLLDPFTFFSLGAGAAVDQARNTNKGFGQGAQGYAKRYGAGYADLVTGLGIDKYVMPILFRQDPRYFYKGSGSTGSRIAYAMSRSFICQGDNGKAQFCYSSFVSRFGTGFISNYYYPRADRDTNAQILESGAISLGVSAARNLFNEFLARKLTPKQPWLRRLMHSN